MHHSKGLIDSYPIMQVLSNVSDFVKSYGHLGKILAFLPQNTHQNMVKSRDSSGFNTSKVIEENSQRGGKHPPPPSPYRVGGGLRFHPLSYRFLYKVCYGCRKSITFV